MSKLPLETIFALSSGQPPAAIGVVRISGPAALDAARSLTTRDLPQPRRAGLRRFVDPATGELLDEGLLLCFPGPNTETGEDMVELHAHGSLAVVRGIEDALARVPGLRRAEPGEFTRRAFLNGRMDLSTIEGLADLLAAETALQRRAAMAMMGGGLSRRVEDWAGALRRLAAKVEAQLDFSDEGDVADAGMLNDLGARCADIAREMETDLAKPSADRLRDGVRVGIGGPPNAGKSTLFNALIGREAAIVSSQAGTTRDILEAAVNIRGIPLILFDSAGLRAGTTDEIEQIGIDRAGALLASVDIVLWLGPVDEQPATQGQVIQIFAKSDVMPAGTNNVGVAVSAVSGAGMDVLVEMLVDAARSILPIPGDYALSRRQQAALRRSASALREADSLTDEILIAECLRQALGALDELTGRVTTEAVLDELFSGFCVGK
jgi:tRNA modification GTPase